MKFRGDQTPSLQAGELQLKPVKTAVLPLNGKYRVALGIVPVRILEFKNKRKEAGRFEVRIYSGKVFKAEILLPFEGFTHRSISPFQNFTEPQRRFEPAVNR